MCSPNFNQNLSPLSKVETPKIMRCKTKPCWFILMPPEALALIADILGHRLPLFMFTNRVSFKQTLQGQLHVYELQRQAVLRQVYLIDQQLKAPFSLSEQSRSELDSIRDDEWRKAI
jgi:hypothetical protein